MLALKNIHINIGDKPVVNGIDLKISPGEIHALMGPNGSGKSSLANYLMGNTEYEMRKEKGEMRNKTQKILLDSVDLSGLSVEDRAKQGLFLAFQHPVSIPGVSVSNLLRIAVNNLSDRKNQSKKESKGKKMRKTAEFRQVLKKNAKRLGIKDEFLERGLNEGFSGGEKKKMEMLQLLALKPKYAIVDEIDTGLDVDALKTVAKAIKSVVRENSTGILLITHYQRILEYVRPDYVHVMIGGRIVKSGGAELAEIVEKEGYGNF